MDNLTRKRRAANMRAIRSKNTAPELVVRKLVYGMGHRYRLHAKHLPGKPDMVFASKRRVIFVHGCFWHQHPVAECLDARRPKSNRAYWHPKLDRNVQRDAEHLAKLKASGWKTLVVWGCETDRQDKLRNRLKRFLD